jgi:hypothetical protein
MAIEHQRVLTMTSIMSTTGERSTAKPPRGDGGAADTTADRARRVVEDSASVAKVFSSPLLRRRQDEARGAAYDHMFYRGATRQMAP